MGVAKGHQDEDGNTFINNLVQHPLRIKPADPSWFEDLADWPWVSKYHSFKTSTLPGETVRMAFVDEGPKDARPVLLLHGQPMWGWLYHGFIQPLLDAGYRVIVPDHVGCGKSDRVVGDDAWYTVEQHCLNLSSFIDAIDLRDAVVVVHDWGGPIGLRQVTDMPWRFDRVVVLNTWLHHIEMNYGIGVRDYQRRCVIRPGCLSLSHSLCLP
jgi:haloalkane dehalogenase